MAYLSKYDKKSTSVISKIGKNLLSILSKVNKLSVQVVVIVYYTIKDFFGIGAGLHITVTENDNIYSTGYNGEGQLGTGYNIPNYSYNKLSNHSKSIIDIQAGTGFTSYLTNDGFIWGWGVATNGVLGDGPLASKSSPVVVIPSVFPQYGILANACYNKLSTGPTHQTALDKSGRAWSWGLGTSGQIGDYTLTTKSSPQPVCMGGRTFCEISVGNNFNIAIDNNGALFAWGDNSLGQLGLGYITTNYSPMAVCQGTRTFCQIVKTYTGQTIALDQNGQAWAWGLNTSGALGINSNDAICYNSPVAVCMGGRTFCQIAIGYVPFVLALDQNGQAWAWGANASGQLGNNTITSQLSPVAVCMGGRTFCKISAGPNFALAISNTGQAFSWGVATNGVLGDTTAVSKSSPVAVCMGGRTFCQISGGTTHCLAISNTGQAFAWGAGANGQLGDTTGVGKSSPVAVCMGGRTFCQISGGYIHSFALDNVGNIFSWGDGTSGILGDNTATGKSSPIAVCMGGRTFCQIMTGNHASSATGAMALTNSGQIFVWGLNTSGQLGDTTVTSRCSPIAICISNKVFNFLSSGGISEAGIDSTGQIWAWGDNTQGGNGNLFINNSMISPIRIVDGNITYCKISSGYNHSLALDKDNNVYGWGNNTNGQTGQIFRQYNPDNFKPTNIRCTYTITPTFITGNLNSIILIDASNNVYSWGSDYGGQLGYEDVATYRLHISRLSFPSTYCVSTIITTGNNNTVGMGGILDQNGQVFVWGSASLLGDNTSAGKCSPVAVCMGGRTFCKLITFTNQSNQSYGLTSTGQLFAWGDNTNGVLGDNTATNKSSPVAVCMGGRTFCQMAQNRDYSARTIHVLDQNGQAFAWGYNSGGEIGDTTSTFKCSPVAVCMGGRTFCQIVSSAYGAYGLSNTGQVFGWGGNTSGQLGDNTKQFKFSPVAVCMGGRTFCQIVVGDGYTITATSYGYMLALDQNGKAFAWGDNTYGQLGDNTTTGKCSPVAVCVGGRTFCQLYSAGVGVLALTHDNQVFTWGYIPYFGDGLINSTCYSSPTSVTLSLKTEFSNKVICNIYAGDKFSYVLDNTGKTFAWGFNTSAQLNIPNIIVQGRPISICQLDKTFCQIAVPKCCNHVLALTHDKKVYGWGNNTYGKVGVGIENSEYTKQMRLVCIPSDKTVKKLAAGTDHSIALMTDDTVYSWGYNLGYQLGTSNNQYIFTPVAVCQNVRTFCNIAMDYQTVFALDTTGQIWSWGTGSTGELGNNSNIAIASPIRVCQNGLIARKLTYSGFIDQNGQAWAWGQYSSGQLGDNTVTVKYSPIPVCQMNINVNLFIRGQNSSFFIDQNGQTFAWGLNNQGQLGNNTTTCYSSPIAVCMGGRTFCQIVVSGSILALDYNGQAFAWGVGTSGQLGDNTATGKSSPVAVCMGGRTFCKISNGSQGFSVALDNTGQAWAWGYNLYGNLGNNTTTSYSSPIAVCMGGRTFCQIAVAITTVIALDQNGQAWAWGYGTSGQLGNNQAGAGVYYSSPVAVCMGGRTFCQIAGELYGAIIALDQNGQAFAWGHNQYGTLGLNSTTCYSSPVAVLQNTNIKTFCQIGVNWYSRYGLTSDGQVYTWGRTSTGSTGFNESRNPEYPMAICMGNRTFCKITKLAANAQFFALDQNGQAFAWGVATNGVLGDNTATNKSSPVPVCMGGRTFCEIISGSTNTFAIDNNKKLWGWGTGGYIGDNSATGQCSPVAVLLTCGTFLTGGYISGTGTLLSNGQVYTWGNNSNGELGNNTRGVGTSVCTPVAVCQGDRTFCRFSKSLYRALVLDQNGQAFAWGDNQYGQMGDNSTTCYCSPVAVCMGGRTFCQISCNNDTMLALDQNGQAWNWGRNQAGQLGDRTITEKSSPVAVCMGGRTFCKIAGGQSVSFALDQNGQAWAWGAGGGYGYLGNNTVANASSPVAVCMGGRTFCHIAYYDMCVIALTNTGQAFAWGYNGSGQLGDNTIIEKSSPVAVCMGGRTFCQIRTAMDAASGILVLDQNGQAWSWGGNFYGNLGNNTTTNYSSPVAVCMGGRTFCQITTMQGMMMAKDINDVLFSWGGNLDYILGNNTATTVSVSSPVAVCTQLMWKYVKVNQVIATTGTSNYIALDDVGKLWSWGQASANLGDNTSTAKSSPVAVCITGRTFCQIIGGTNKFAALDTTGQIWTWGASTVGELGDNSYVAKSSPVAVCQGNRTFCQLYHTISLTTFAKDSTGNYFVWGGFTSSADFGTPSLTCINYNINSPIQICLYGKTACDIIVAANNTLLLDNTGQTWAWGLDDATNQILGTSELRMCRVTPVYADFVNQIRTTCQIDVGSLHNILNDSTGQLWTWGKTSLPNVQEYGVLGLNKTGDEFMPRPVCLCGIKVKSNIFTAGISHNVFNSTFDRPYAWGQGTMLGDNTTTARSQPVAVCLDSVSGLKTVKAGYNFTIGIANNDTIWAWGSNGSGMLGDNTTTERSSPVPVCLGRANIASLLGGNYYVDKTNQIWTWGSNSLGSLGLNSIIQESSPIAVCMGGRTFCNIVHGDVHSLALDQNGQAWAWGLNTQGQLGNNEMAIAYGSPIAVCMGGRTFCQITAGMYYSLALDQNGQVWGWGANTNGELGNTQIGAGNSKSSPIAVCMGGRTFCRIAAGMGYHSLALDINGQTWAWGYNQFGQLGNNTVTNASSPVAVCIGGRTFCQISVGYDHSLALDNQGQAWAWGYNQYGYLGDNTTTQKSSPIAVCIGGRTFCKINIGYQYSLAIDNFNQAWTWGRNDSGKLGNNTFTDYSSPVAVCQGNRTFCQIYARIYHSLALDQNGQAFAWGDNKNGRVGNNITSSYHLSPMAVCMGGRTFCKIYPGYYHSTALDGNGKMWSWGGDENTLLGINNIYYVLSPVKFNINNRTVNKIYKQAFIDNNGQAWTWGSNTYYTLGNNSTISYGSPVAVCMGGRTFCQIAMEVNHTLALDQNGQAWAWGYNPYGSIGDNTTTDYSSPVAVCMGGRTFCQIVVGNHISLALDNFGRAWAWGFNNAGGIGDNTITNYSSPVAVCMGGRTFCKLANYFTSSSFWSLVLDQNGQAFAWGYNGAGQLGNNTTTCYSSPVAVCMGGRTFCQIAIGTNHTLALDQNGQAWAWGFNSIGQLGNNTITNYSSPVAVCMGGRIFCAIASHGSNSLALDKNGLVWAWGDNIGNNDITFTTKSSPVAVCVQQVMCGVNIRDFSVGYQSSILIENENNVWSWGLNTSGILGDNTATNRLVPTAVCIGGRTFCKIYLGYTSAIALDPNGQAFSWGLNTFGQLGNLNIISQCSPVAVYMPVTYTINNFGGAIFLLSTNQVYSWGYNSTGQIGDNTTIEKSSPVPICMGGRTFCKIIKTNNNNSFGIEPSGKLWGWGVQIGNNVYASYNSPIEVCTGGRTFCQISGNTNITVALDSQGQAWAWGRNDQGQIGNNFSSAGYVNSPVAVCMGGRTFCQISTYAQGVVALDNFGQAWSWGDGQSGKLGNNTTTCYSSPVAVCMGGRTFCKVSGGNGVVVLDNFGQAWSWGGDNISGDNTTTGKSSPVAVCMGGRTFCEITVNGSNVLVLNDFGEAFTWGSGTSGLLGDNTTTAKSSPVAVCMGGRIFCQIFIDSSTAFARDMNNLIFSWGSGTSGLLGDNTTTAKSSPVAVCIGAYNYNKTFCKITPVKKYNALTTLNTDGYMGITTDNKYYIWGANIDGAWGKDTIAPYIVPVPTCMCKYSTPIKQIVVNNCGVDALTSTGQLIGWGLKNYTCKIHPTVLDNRTYCKLTAAYYNFYALDTNGQAFSWGGNTYGELGNNTKTATSSPVAVCMGGRTFCQIIGLQFTTIGLTNTGTAFSWGYATGGELGNFQTTTSYSSPIAVCMGGRTFCQISGNESFVCALTNLGQAFAWGTASTGGLGDNTTTAKSSPVAVCMGGRTFCQISVGWRYTLALDQNGQAFGWGDNSNGNLGDNTATGKSSPVAVCMGGRIFCQIFAGARTSFALDNNNQLWAWGYNGTSTLGNNNVTHYSSPIAVYMCNRTIRTLGQFAQITQLSPYFLMDTNDDVWAWGGNLNATIYFDGKLPWSTYPIEYSFPAISCQI